MKKVELLQRFLREPLFHFILIGGLFFLVYSRGNEISEDPVDTIIITPVRIGQIATEFKGVWNRTPTAEEFDHLIGEEVRSEVYYRDALALELDKNDAIIRRRLRQKMEFLTDTSIYLQEPSSAELLAYFAANQQVYRSEPLLAFEQVYLGRDASEVIVARTLKQLLATPAMDTSTLGQRTLLPAQLKLSPPGVINSVFGKGFYLRASSLVPGKWDGPVTSVYGIHLVRTLDGNPGRTPALEEVRNSVVQDWKSAKAGENREADYLKRRNRYSVEILRDENTEEIVAKEKR